MSRLNLDFGRQVYKHLIPILSLVVSFAVFRARARLTVFAVFILMQSYK